MSSTLTRSDIRNNIRQDLYNWPLQSSLDQALDPNSNTLTLPDDVFEQFTEQQSLLEIDSEIMRVVDIPKAGRSMRVIRAFMGSVAAGHTKGSTVLIHKSWGWTNFELNQRIIPQAIRWLKPYAWIEQVSSTFTWANGTIQATAPSGVAYPDGDFIYRMEVLDTDSVYKQFLAWKLFGTTLRFNRKASSDRTLRARLAHFQSVLNDDTTTLDNDQFIEAISKYAAHLCLNALKTNRVRYAEYAASLNDRASTPDELIRVAFDLKNQAIVSRDENAYPRPATFASTYNEFGAG